MTTHYLRNLLTLIIFIGFHVKMTAQESTEVHESGSEKVVSAVLPVANSTLTPAPDAREKSVLYFTWLQGEWLDSLGNRLMVVEDSVLTMMMAENIKAYRILSVTKMIDPEGVIGGDVISLLLCETCQNAKGLSVATDEEVQMKSIEFPDDHTMIMMDFSEKMALRMTGISAKHSTAQLLKRKL